MAKTVTKKIKIIAPGGAAVLTPAMGQVLGPAGVNIGEFVKRFNEATQDMKGDLIPAEISVYQDRTYDFILKTPPASSLILKAIGKDKGSGKPNLSKVGVLSKDKLREIAEKKMRDLNAPDIETAMKTVAGSARSMGVDIK